jgi:GT2 family glycosyltransferase
MAFPNSSVNAATRVPDDLDISVIVTLMDDRGTFQECLSSWTRGQTYPRHRYEVVVVGSGREPGPEAIARTLVTAGDRLLIFQAPNEMALFDRGARQARGKWLLFTEAHCAAEPCCLAELVAYLEAHDGRYHGACIRTTSDGNAHPLAAMEGRWYQEGFAAWSQEGDWRKVTIRGTAVHRDAYAGVGGFKSAFGCFAEILLAAELHAAGYRLGYAPAAAIKHYNATAVRDMEAYVNEYRAGEAAFRDLEGSERFAHYFGWSEDLDGANAADRRLAFRCAARSLMRGIAQLHRPGAAAKARAMFGVLMRLTADVISTGQSGRLRAAIGYACARAQFALPARDADQRYRRFCRLWNAMSDLASARVRARNRGERGTRLGQMPERLHYRPGNLESGALIGFHGRETYEGLSFRWTSPVASMRVSLPPADYEVRVDTRHLVGAPPPAFMDAYLNGRLMPRAPESTSGIQSFQASRAMFHDGALQRLVLTSGRLRNVAPAEQRSLGIPVFSVHFVPRPATSAGFPQPDFRNESWNGSARPGHKLACADGGR